MSGKGKRETEIKKLYERKQIRWSGRKQKPRN